MTYDVDVYVPPARNPHHPNGGWFTIARGQLLELATALIEAGVAAGGDRSRYRMRPAE